MGVSASSHRPLHRAVLLPWWLASPRVSNEDNSRSQSDGSSLMLYSVGQTEQPRHTVGQDYTKAHIPGGGSWGGHTYFLAPLYWE